MEDDVNGEFCDRLVKVDERLDNLVYWKCEYWYKSGICLFIGRLLIWIIYILYSVFILKFFNIDFRLGIIYGCCKFRLVCFGGYLEEKDFIWMK